MPINSNWHAKNPMPPRPTMTQRIKWHIAHAKHCACRPIPPIVRMAIREAPQLARTRS